MSRIFRHCSANVGNDERYDVGYDQLYDVWNDVWNHLRHDERDVRIHPEHGTVIDDHDPSRTQSRPIVPANGVGGGDKGNVHTGKGRGFCQLLHLILFALTREHLAGRTFRRKKP